MSSTSSASSTSSTSEPKICKHCGSFYLKKFPFFFIIYPEYTSDKQLKVINDIQHPNQDCFNSYNFGDSASKSPLFNDSEIYFTYSDSSEDSYLDTRDNMHLFEMVMQELRDLYPKNPP